MQPPPLQGLPCLGRAETSEPGRRLTFWFRSEWTLRHWDVKALISKNTMKSWILAEILCVAKRAGPQSTPRTASTSGDKVVQAQGTSVAAVPQAGCSAPHRAPTSLECLLGVHNWRGDSYSAWEATGLLQFPASPRMPPRTHRPALGRGESASRAPDWPSHRSCCFSRLCICPARPGAWAPRGSEQTKMQGDSGDRVPPVGEGAPLNGRAGLGLQEPVCTHGFSADS